MTAMGRLLLDSADLRQAEEAGRSGIVTGVTTNPSILATTGRPRLERISELLEVFTAGWVFYQLTASREDEIEAEVRELRDAAARHVDRLVLKLPAQPKWYRAGAEFVRREWPVAFTAVYDPGQAVCATESGASWIIPYVDRHSRLMPEAEGVIAQLRPFVPDGVNLLAASLKTPFQTLEALKDGADAVTTSWDVIEGLMRHPLTDSAVEEFERATEQVGKS